MDNMNNREENESVKVVYVASQATSKRGDIDLLDLFHTLWRRKLVVIITTFLTILATVVYLFSYTSIPLYKSQASLSIGRIINRDSAGRFATLFLEKNDNLIEYLNASHEVTASVSNKNANYIFVEAIGETRQVAENILLEAMDDVLVQHEVIYNSIVNSIIEELALLDKQLNYYFNDALPQMEKDLELLYVLQGSRLNDLTEKTSLGVEMNFLLNELVSVKESHIREIERLLIPGLEMKKLEIQEIMNERFLKKTVLVGGIHTTLVPHKPTKKLILMVGLVAGLMIGIFLVFFLEFIKPTKAEE